LPPDHRFPPEWPEYAEFSHDDPMVSITSGALYTPADFDPLQITNLLFRKPVSMIIAKWEELNLQLQSAMLAANAMPAGVAWPAAASGVVETYRKHHDRLPQ